jgi:glycosyltransferase involved in cell wall biosynthesis
LEVRRSFPSDAVVLDVRGAWPYEVLLAKGVTRVEDARGETRTAFEAALAKLRHCIELADGVTTVSENLKKWLVEAANAPAETTVIPCCVSSTVDDRNRDVIRRSWGITNEKVYVYLGTTVSRSQGLEDLVMPFLRASQIVSADVRALLLTPDLDAMRGLAHRAGLDPERTMIMHVPQADVRHVLTAADVGLLLRPAIFMNRWSQPTKLGEYLASGLPVIVEEGTGDVPTMLAASEAGLTVHLGASGVSIAEEAQRAYVWVRESGGAARQRARQLAERDFLWRSVSPTIRKLYRQSLQRRSAVSDRSEASPVSIGSPSESPRTLLRAADR